MKNKKGHAEFLRGKGLRATPQRIALLETLSQASRPLSVPELQELELKKSMDTVTFYRGLETLVEAGLVRTVNLQHGHTDYELVAGKGHHHHIVCRNCDKIEEVSWCPDRRLERAVLKESGFSVLDEHALEFFGLCTSCA